jgi:hypothetical protein
MGKSGMSKSGENPTADDTATSSASPDAAVETGALAPDKKLALAKKKKVVPEIGGPSGLEPTRYGDWERKGRCIDF